MERNLQYDKINMLTIAGLDPSGGAGLLADARVWQNEGLHTLVVPTCNTAQTHDHCYDVWPMNLAQVIQQVQLMITQYDIGIIKLGAFPNWEMLQKVLLEIEQEAPDATIVWDPVIKPTSGTQFLDISKAPENLASLLNEITLITPNEAESKMFLSQLNAASWEEAGLACSVLTTGTQNVEKYITDVLVEMNTVTLVESKRIPDADFHGSGCTHTALICAAMAKGVSVLEAVEMAQSEMQSFFTNHANQKVYG